MLPENHQYVKRLAKAYQENDMDVVYLKPFHYSSIMNILKIISYRLQGYRIIHVHWLYSFPLILVMRFFCLFCKMLNIKIVWEMHQILPHHPKKSDIKKYSIFYKNVDGIIYHSENDKSRVKEILHVNENKINTIIPHANFNDSYLNNITMEEARLRLGIEQNVRVILCFGFFRKNRGYEYLTDATKDMNNTIVLIVGNKQDKETYNKLKEFEKEYEYIRLIVGWIPDNDIQIYFNASDIVVLPYTEIYTSGVVPLAYAFSKPVITTDAGNMKEVVNEKTGILIKPGNSIELRDAIEDLFSKDYKAMGMYAHSYAEHEFNWDNNAGKIKKLFKELI